MGTQNRHVNKTISDDYRLRYHCDRGADLNAFRSVERSYSGEKNTTATDLSTYNHHFKRYRKQYDKSYRKQYNKSFRKQYDKSYRKQYDKLCHSYPKLYNQGYIYH